MNIIAKINLIQDLLKTHQLDGFLIPSNDEFQNEYVPNHLNRLKYLTGFTGSNGYAIITSNKNIFFTDGRYLLQAEQELGNIFEIHDISKLCSFLDKKIGYDPKLHTSNFIKQNPKLIEAPNLIDLIWQNKPEPNLSEIFSYPLKYAGESSDSKRQKIIHYLAKQELDALIITDPTNICWLLNIRAHDVAYNPILLSYLIFHQNGEIELFYNSSMFEQFSTSLKKLQDKKVQLDQNSASIWIINHFSNPILKEDPCLLAKACKNAVEIKQARRIHVIDGVAVCKLLYWLEQNNNLTELDVAQKLLEFRQEHPDFIYPSFPTIAGFAEHGAIIHYQPNIKTNKKLEANGLFLLDSGGQYFGGTTDITRVIPIGRSTKQQKHDFTLVLKGHIALAKAKFPIGTSGAKLDSLARYYLWQDGKNYAHGTGHGVGNCLSVHEGPQRISPLSNQALLPGMILSNEPGYYKPQEYGIRIENLMLVKNSIDGYLAMEILSLAPVDKRLIIVSNLSADEKKWLNSYHQQIYKKISPHLNQKEQAWLRLKTNPL